MSAHRSPHLWLCTSVLWRLQVHWEPAFLLCPSISLHEGTWGAPLFPSSLSGRRNTSLLFEPLRCWGYLLLQRSLAHLDWYTVSVIWGSPFGPCFCLPATCPIHQISNGCLFSQGSFQRHKNQSLKFLKPQSSKKCQDGLSNDSRGQNASSAKQSKESSVWLKSLKILLTSSEIKSFGTSREIVCQLNSWTLPRDGGLSNWRLRRM